jgi:transposase
VGVLPKVDSRGDTQVQAAPEQDPRALGCPFSVWTCLDLARYLVKHGQELVSGETIRRHLQKLGYRVIRPVLSITSPDPEYVAKAEHLEACRERARQGDIILLYEDEIDLNLLPGVIRCWTKRGQQRKVQTPGQNVKRYGFGAVNFMTGQLTYRTGERKNSDGFCALIEQIVQEYCPGKDYTGPKIGLVVDNYIIHHSQKTTTLLQKYADRLFIIPLPTYAPKLNVMELFWKYLRRKVTHNHLFESIIKLVEAVEDFVQSLKECRTQILSVIGCSG